MSDWIPSTLPAGTAGSAALQGFLLCLGLIVAIGAQNAFVLRQGLRREHVGLLAALCSASDALLIAAGVAGVAGLVAAHPGLSRWMAVAGMLFLLAYGLQAWRRAWHGESMAVAAGPGLSRRAAVLQLAGFTLLNPHVYLDTVLLMGSVGAQWPGPTERTAFVAGAALASTLWFHGLAYGARAMAGWFARPVAWRVLDTVIGAMMLALCAGLLPLALGR